MSFDVDGPALLDTLFGLPEHPDPRVVVQAVPFDATTSSRPGTAGCVPFVLEASHQVDVYHPCVEAPWEAGITLRDAPDWVEPLSARTRELVEAVRDGDGSLLDEVNAAGSRIDAFVHAFAAEQIAMGRIPAVLGGDHSVPQGAMRAAVERWPHLGVLHVDAHADLRVAYEGFRHSHASIFDNVLHDGVQTLVQVGIRDLCSAEADRHRDDPRIHAFTDRAIALREAEGVSFAEQAAAWVALLPDHVWVSFDIDGLDPALCPATGTPVPGGLSWRDARILLETLGRSGKTLVGFDLCEVGASEWDANVGARLLFELAAWAVHTGRTNA
ncbi:MAG: arginase family protein [Alphaproteobacteria bacterium]|nr:arginase family protein [Alphaproteobacteria bacterium]